CRSTSATPPSTSALTKSTTAASTPPRSAFSATPRRPRTSSRTCSCASGVIRPSSMPAAATSAPICASWHAPGRSTCGARARRPAAPAIVSRSPSVTTSRVPTSARPRRPSARRLGAPSATSCASSPARSARRSSSPTGAGSPPTRSRASRRCRSAPPRAASGSGWRACAPRCPPSSKRP
ncbi:MAG: RNA polymerase sigma-70 factor, partial [uncultured Solirubrobacteraceae bacterium]